MGKIVCGDTYIQEGKPHSCSAEPGHKAALHVCCCGAAWTAPKPVQESKTKSN